MKIKNVEFGWKLYIGEKEIFIPYHTPLFVYIIVVIVIYFII